jgi:hypothetical protein
MAKPIFTLTLLCATLLKPGTGVALAITGINDPAAVSSAQPNSIIEWNRTLLQIVRTPGAQPATIHSTRNFAMLHIAIFEAVNSIDRSFEPYSDRMPRVSRRASTQAAADQSAHDVLIALYPSFAATLDSQLQQDLSQIPHGEDKNEGVRVGQAAATEILALRSNDGSTATPPPFVPKNQPGFYQLTPPNFAPADFTQWSQVKPFAIFHANQFRPTPPPHLTSDEYTQSFDEVMSLGILNSTTRTSDQTQIGQFWNGNIQDFWNEITQTAVLQHHLDLPHTAQLFALVNIALADTAISFFEAKYVYNLWRPVTAIQMADTDGNPGTQSNAEWIPLPTKTAPDPSYPGAHSAISFAAAEVLQLYFHDRTNFDVTSESLPGATRHFNTFADAAEEAGLSRIYAGQHFRFDHLAGQQLGRRVAVFVVFTSLHPRLNPGIND